MGGNSETLRSHYQKLPDEDIEHLANYEAADLSPSACDILKEEIKRRGLSDELNLAADIQVRGISEGELLDLIRRISTFPCPICGKKRDYLNGFNLMSVRSYIIVTSVSNALIIACPECISAMAKRALIKNLFLGWLGIPWGPIKTIRSVFANLRAMNSGKHNGPTKEFVEFIKPRSAAIKARFNKITDVRQLLDVISQSAN
jgi:hypothetical protein